MPGTHWEGPLLGSENARGGLFRGMNMRATEFGTVSDALYGDPAATGQNLGRWTWTEQFVEADTIAPTGRYFTLTQIVAGTVTLAAEQTNHVLNLNHGTADQGPAVRYLGSQGGGDSICRPTTATVTSFECRARHQTNVATNDAFIGFYTSVAAHPLVAAGTLNTAAISQGVGFHWLDANDGRPVLVAWVNNTAETLVNPPTLATDVVGVFREFGVRMTGAITGGPSAEFYVGGLRIFRHQFSAAMTGRMTFGAGLVSNAAGAQFHLDSLVLAFRH